MSKQNEPITHKEVGDVTHSEFKQEIGVFGGVSILGGIMIGSGIFYLGSYALQRTGMSLGLSILAWIIGGLVSLLGGLCYAELGASDPRAGGSHIYLSEAYHPVVGYMSAFASMLVSGAGSIAGVAVALPTALRTFFDLSDVAIKVIAIVIVILFTVINLFGVKTGSRVQNISMVLKLAPLLVIMFGALIFGKQSPDLSLTSPENPDMGFFGIIGLLSFATIATLWAYEGWTNLNTVAEEMKNPQRNLPLAIIIAILGITAIYTLFNFAIFRFLPYEEIVGHINAGQLYLGTEVSIGLMGNFGGILVTVAMVLSMLGSINGMVLAFPRMYYSMAADGHFFKAYAQLHPKYKVPTAAILGQCVITCVLILLRNLSQLTSLVVFSGMLFKVMVMGAVIIYRKKFPDLKRPYKVIGYPFTIIIAILIDVFLMFNTLKGDPSTALIGLSVPLLGAVVYFIFDKKLKAEGKA